MKDGNRRARVTISHMMAATLVVALALAPIPAALRTPTQEFIVATVAYEIVFLPNVVALIAMAMMAPGRKRTFVMMTLCATPVILVTVLFVGSYALVMVVVVVRMVVGPEPFSLDKLVFCISVVWAIYLLTSRLPKRCPNCRRRRLRELSRHVPEQRVWQPSGVYKCDGCGRCCRAIRSGLRIRMVSEEPEPPTPDHN